jgi:trans-aconitate methyltransferase
MTKLYSELANWWPLLSPPEDYAEEATFFRRIFDDAKLPDAPTLIELGSGGGSNAFYFKSMFSRVTLTDLSPQMLAVSGSLNPECEHVEGDMRTLRLGFQADVVFTHDAIDYMTTLTDLRQALETAFVHCKPGGLAIFVPDHVRETFESSTEHGGTDGPERSLRYLEWTYDPDESDTTCITEYIYAFREGNQPVQVEHDTHTCGVFPRAEWLRLLGDLGFTTKIVSDEVGRDIFVARRG